MAWLVPSSKDEHGFLQHSCSIKQLTREEKFEQDDARGPDVGLEAVVFLILGGGLHGIVMIRNFHVDSLIIKPRAHLRRPVPQATNGTRETRKVVTGDLLGCVHETCETIRTLSK